MNIKIKTLLKSYTFFLISMGLPFFISLALIPIIINSIGLFKFGLLSICFAFYSFIPLCDLGVSKKLIHLISQKENNSTHFNSQVVYNSFLLTLIISFVFSIVFIINYIIIDFYLEKFYIYKEILLITIIGFPIILFSNIIKSYYESILNFKISSFLQAINASSIYLGPYISINFGFEDLSQLIISFIFLRGLGLIIGLFMARNYIYISKINFNKSLLFELLSFGKHSSLLSLTTPFFVISDRVTLSKYGDRDSAGIFAASSEFLSKIFGLVGIFGTILFPYFSNSNINNNKIKYFNNNLLLIILLSSPLLVLTITFSNKIALYIYSGFPPENSVVIIIILSIGYYFNGLSQLCVSYLYARNNLAKVSWAAILQLFIYLPFLVIMVYYYDVIGAAISLSIRLVFDFISLYTLIILSNLKK